MSMMRLKREDIDIPDKRGKYTICVVGCGRMGLPTACLFAEAGFKIVGVDVNQHIVDLLKKGKVPFSEPGLQSLVKKHTKEGRLRVSKNAKEAISASNVIVIVVPTLTDQKKKPDYSKVERACKEIGMGLRYGSFIIFESTVGPGVTDNLVIKTLERVSGLKVGVDFGFAYSPIRASRGQILKDISTYPRVVAAVDEASLKTACLILATIVRAEMIKVRNIKTAEVVKLFENVYRDVNIALANEFALFCEKARIDFFAAQQAANTQPHCQLLAPGIVSGHMPTSAYFLIEEAENVNAKLRMVTLARKTNDEILRHTLRLTREALRKCQRTIRRAKISVLGVSYRPDVKVVFGSMIKELIDLLKKKGAIVRVYDPLFSHKKLVDLGYPAEKTLTKTIEGANLLLIAIGHDRFKRLNIRRAKFLMRKPAAIIDMGCTIDPTKAEEEGFVYRGLGRGIWSK